MKSWVAKALGLAASAAVTMALFPASVSAATPEEVDAAIKKGKEYVWSQMKGDNWELVPAPVGDEQSDPAGKQWGGTTSLAVYGLLAAGEKSANPKLVPAIEYLKKAAIGGHYASGIRAQVWTFLKLPDSKTASKNDFVLLLAGMHSDPVNRGLYPYWTDLKTGKPQKDWADHSVSQYGVLGMWACEQAGQEVPSEYWKIVDARWRADQKPDGGWGYLNGEASRFTMSAAGLATLFITQDYLLQANKWDRCAGGIRNENIERALAYMDKNAPAALHGTDHYFYAMYGMERIGVASGRKYFGTTDWYQVGADEIVKKQNADGSWGAEEAHFNPKKVADTVFSMLFLSRGRAPVIMNKLEYSNGGAGTAGATSRPAVAVAAVGPKKQDDPWNERPRDVANFTHWASKQVEQYLNWQIVNLRVPSEDLHDSPIIYISGSEAMDFNDADLNKLRQFVEDGGMILGNADCGSKLFSSSFVNLGRKLFTKYEFRPLPANHSIYTDQQFRPTKWMNKPTVEALSNGVRELMILIPDADLSRSWQTRAEKTKQVNYELMQDIFLYAMGKTELRYRGDTYIISADPKAVTDKSIKVARIIAGDNADPEPGAWRRAANYLRNTAKTAVTVENIKLGENKLDPKQIKFAHLTGTTKWKLRPEYQAEIKAFVNGGGTLLVDSAGGATEFADSAETELATLFAQQPGNIGDILDPTSDVYNLAGAKIEKFGYRAFVKGRLTGKLNAPRLRGIKIGNRIGVFYSREDLTAGLVGQPTDGIIGYDPATATDIVRNLVLYANGAKSAAGAAPAAAASEK